MSEISNNSFNAKENYLMGEVLHNISHTKDSLTKSPSVMVVSEFRAVHSWLRSFVGRMLEHITSERIGTIRPEDIIEKEERAWKYIKPREKYLNALLDRFAALKKNGLDYKALEAYDKTRSWDVKKTVSVMTDLLNVPPEERFKLNRLVPESYAKVKNVLVKDLISVISRAHIYE